MHLWHVRKIDHTKMMHKFILNQEQRPIYSMQFFLHDRTKVLVRRPFYSMNSFTDLLTIRGRRGRDRMVVEFTKEEAQPTNGTNICQYLENWDREQCLRIAFLAMWMAPSWLIIVYIDASLWLWQWTSEISIYYCHETCLTQPNNVNTETLLVETHM
jgi:hypothetical protein